MVHPNANISSPKLDPDGSFRVREFTALSIIAAAVFYGIFFLALSDMAGPQYWSEDHRHNVTSIFELSLVPAIVFTYKAIRRRVYITVNGNGIYLYKTFITAWPNFVDAMYKDEPQPGGITDNYMLYIYYLKNGTDFHEVKFKLGDTQNRGEEEVIAAIRYFYVQSGYGVVK